MCVMSCSCLAFNQLSTDYTLSTLLSSASELLVIATSLALHSCFWCTHRHLEIFEFIRMEDEREFAMRLQLVSNTAITQCSLAWFLSTPQMETVDYTNPSKMAEILQRKTVYTAAYPHYISILYHCLLIPSERLEDKPETDTDRRTDRIDNCVKV